MIGIVIPQNVIITALFYDCDCILPDRQINYVAKGDWKKEKQRMGEAGEINRR